MFAWFSRLVLPVGPVLLLAIGGFQCIEREAAAWPGGSGWLFPRVGGRKRDRGEADRSRVSPGKINTLPCSPTGKKSLTHCF